MASGDNGKKRGIRTTGTGKGSAGLKNTRKKSSFSGAGKNKSGETGTRKSRIDETDGMRKSVAADRSVSKTEGVRSSQIRKSGYMERSRIKQAEEGRVKQFILNIGGKQKGVVTKYDFTLLMTIFILIVFGLMMVTSASAYTAVKYNVSATHYLVRQLEFAIVGIVVMIAISKFDYRILTRKLPGVKFGIPFIFYCGCLLLQILVLFAGDSSNGSTRWIELPVIGRFQPSEFSKICIIILVAHLISMAPRKLDSIMGFLVIALVNVPLIALVLSENLSTALVMAGILAISCFIASRKWFYYVFILIGGAGIATLGILVEPYRRQRIVEWLYEGEKAYQVQQGLYAVCSGGWFGKGLGNGVQKLGYVPEVHTDMIFSIICEELGLFGVLILFTVYGILLWRIYKISVNAPDLFGSMICAGVFIHIALQMILNVGVVTALLPATGVTLPFISYGGTSLVSIMIEMGLVLSVAARIEHDI